MVDPECVIVRCWAGLCAVLSHAPASSVLGTGWVKGSLPGVLALKGKLGSKRYKKYEEPDKTV